MPTWRLVLIGACLLFIAVVAAVTARGDSVDEDVPEPDLVPTASPQAPQKARPWPVAPRAAQQPQPASAPAPLAAPAVTLASNPAAAPVVIHIYAGGAAAPAAAPAMAQPAFAAVPMYSAPAPAPTYAAVPVTLAPAAQPAPRPRARILGLISLPWTHAPQAAPQAPPVASPQYLMVPAAPAPAMPALTPAYSWPQASPQSAAPAAPRKSLFSCLWR